MTRQRPQKRPQNGDGHALTVGGPWQAAAMAPEQFGTLDLTRINRSWSAIEQLQPALERADAFNANPGATFTARRFDEAQAAGKRTYILCGQLLASALDHHFALRDLLLGNHGLTPFAPWTLMRSVFEASVLVHWILEPAEGIERRRRGLRRTCLDLKEHKNWMDAAVAGSEVEAAKAAKRHAEVTSIYQAEAADLGIPWSKIHQTMKMTEELPKLDVVRTLFADQASFSVVVWRWLSGHAHGFGYATVASSKIERSVQIPGGQAVVVTVGDDSFTAIAMMTAMMLLKAILLYADRSERPIAAPSAATL